MTRTDHLEAQPGTAVAPVEAAAFRSILFPRRDPELAAGEPACFGDLNLDQVVARLVEGRGEYDLAPFFRTPLLEVEDVVFRQEVCRDLARPDVSNAVQAFAVELRRVRGHLDLAHGRGYPLERQRWLLDAATLYCGAVAALADALARVGPDSRGLRALRTHLAAYTRSEAFASLDDDARRVRDGLRAVRYLLRIRGARVTVSRYDGEADYGAEVERSFERFRAGAVEDHLVKVPDPGSMDHVEARIAERVARLFPAEFGALDEFWSRHGEFVEPRLARFDREAQFYLAYLEHTERIAARGLPFCYPLVSQRPDALQAEEAYDLALAARVAGKNDAIVCNDFRLRRPERVLVVTGPNQGGKTTFARMVGQLHYLASLGVPVPARRARLFLPDRVFTHFERVEDVSTLRGKLDDELVRVHEIIGQASGDSVVILNEVFASTTLADAVHLGTEILRRLGKIGCPTVCVTFVDALASLGDATVSMVAGVARDDPSHRTFRIERRPADGRAYAWAIAEKYGLSYDRLRRRIAR